MKVILTGATGYVGEGILLAMLDDNRIEKILSVGRRHCCHSHSKLEEYIVPDMLTLKADDEKFKGYDVVFFIAGITSVGTPIETYRTISYDIPVHFAKIMPNKKRMTYIYLSGAGTKENGRQAWQKIKASTEKEVQSMGFLHAYGWRPAMMTPYHGQLNRQVKGQKVALLFYPIMRLFGMVCSMKEMVNAMITASSIGYNKTNIEARDILKLQ